VRLGERQSARSQQKKPRARGPGFFGLDRYGSGDQNATRTPLVKEVFWVWM
jgi:hypothetical protein